MAVNRKCVAVIFVQTVFRSKPHKSAAVLHNVADKIIGQTIIYCQVFKFEILGLGIGKRRNEDKKNKYSEKIGHRTISYGFTSEYHVPGILNNLCSYS